MLDGVSPAPASDTISHTAKGVDAPARQAQPTGRKRSVWFATDPMSWKETSKPDSTCKIKCSCFTGTAPFGQPGHRARQPLSRCDAKYHSVRRNQGRGTPRAPGSRRGLSRASLSAELQPQSLARSLRGPRTPALGARTGDPMEANSFALLDSFLILSPRRRYFPAGSTGPGDFGSSLVAVLLAFDWLSSLVTNPSTN